MESLKTSSTSKNLTNSYFLRGVKAFCLPILTSHLSSNQLKILVKLGVRVVFALDKEVRIRDDRNIEKLKRYVNVEYIYDWGDLLGEKDAPVDKGREVFKKLYDNRLTLR